MLFSQPGTQGRQTGDRGEGGEGPVPLPARRQLLGQRVRAADDQQVHGDVAGGLDGLHLE